MTENKKKKINIIDLLTVLVLILLIVAAYVKFGKYNVKTEDSTQGTLLYTVDVYSVRNYTAMAYQSGDIVFDSLTGVNIGVIQNVEMTDAVTYEPAQDGKLVKAINPYKKDLVITIKTPGTVENNAYYANKSIELKVNSQKAIETKYAKTTGTISSINVECE
jgi:hypothetical protein